MGIQGRAKRPHQDPSSMNDFEHERWKSRGPGDHDVWDWKRCYDARGETTGSYLADATRRAAALVSVLV